jgi:hypothetical protein
LIHLSRWQNVRISFSIVLSLHFYPAPQLHQSDPSVPPAVFCALIGVGSRRDSQIPMMMFRVQFCFSVVEKECAALYT